MHFHTENPEQGIVENGIDVRRHGIIAAQGDQGALLDLLITGQVAVDQQALVGIAGPDPLVALDAVQEERAGAEHKGVRCHGKDAVQFRVPALERCTHGDIDILMDRPGRARFRGKPGDERIAQRLARAAAGFRIRRAEIIAVHRVERFGTRFSEADGRHFQDIPVPFKLERGCQFRLKGEQRAAADGFRGNGQIDFLRERPFGRIARRVREVTVEGCRHRV